MGPSWGGADASDVQNAFLPPSSPQLKLWSVSYCSPFMPLPPFLALLILGADRFYPVCQERMTVYPCQSRINGGMRTGDRLTHLPAAVNRGGLAQTSATGG